MKNSNKHPMSVSAKIMKIATVAILFGVLFFVAPKTYAQNVEARVEYDNVYYSYNYPPYDWSTFYITSDVYIALYDGGVPYTPPSAMTIYYEERKTGYGSYDVVHSFIATTSRNLLSGGYTLSEAQNFPEYYYYLDLNTVSSPNADYTPASSTSY